MVPRRMCAFRDCLPARDRRITSCQALAIQRAWTTLQLRTPNGFRRYYLLRPTLPDMSLDANSNRLCKAWDQIRRDHENFYSGPSLAALGVGLAGAALFANTSWDQNFNHFYRENVRNVHSDEYAEFFHEPKTTGNGWVTLSVFAGGMLADSLWDTPVTDWAGQWGSRSLRTVLVGGPPMLALQYATGASRPGENPWGSQWKPLEDNNGVSGHAFMAAVPFLVAAEMTEDPYWTTGLYVASCLGGLSRINDEHRYASQVILGWWIAYLASQAVNETTRQQQDWMSILPLPPTTGPGIAVELRR